MFDWHFCSVIASLLQPMKLELKFAVFLLVRSMYEKTMKKVDTIDIAKDISSKINSFKTMIRFKMVPVVFNL